MGISCANRIVGKTNKEIQCKHKELNSTLPAYAIKFIGAERGATQWCREQDRSLIQVTQCDLKVKEQPPELASAYVAVSSKNFLKCRLPSR